jgi:hypothetical protein
MTSTEPTWSKKPEGRRASTLLPFTLLLTLLAAPMLATCQGDRTVTRSRPFGGQTEGRADDAQAGVQGPVAPELNGPFGADWYHAVSRGIVNDQYVPQRIDDGFLLRNSSQNLEARVSDTGVEVRRSGVEPIFIGGSALRAADLEWPLEPGTPTLDACVKGPLLDARGACSRSVRGERSVVSEIWENRPDGLEHTFIVRRPIEGDSLELIVRVTGARLTLDSDGTEARLSQTETGLHLRYAGLRAWDAGGRALSARMRIVGAGLSLAVDVKNAKYPVVVDPVLTDVAWSAESNQARAYFGDAVANAGDVNQDGFEDVIIGAPYFDFAASDTGRAYLYLGGASGLSTSAAWTADGDLANATFGDSVAGVGDVDDDGFDDIAVAAPRRENAPGQGRVYLYRGGRSGPSTTPDWSSSSVLPAELYGYEVAGAGDVNDDGYDDVVIGARAYYDGQANEGRAIAFYGSAAGLASTPEWQVESNQAGALFGDAVASAGDVNDDGYDDVIIGARNFDNPLTNEGAAYVYLGSSSGLAAAAVWSAEGNQAGALFGSAVLGNGDVNGDGYDDIAVSAPNYDQLYTDEGAVFLYLGGPSGPATNAAWTEFGNQASAHFGEALAFGDVDGDGRSDLVVGAPDWDQGLAVDNGRAYLYRGQDAASGLGTSEWLTTGMSSDDQLGSSVAGLDVNADGLGDIVVGAWTHDVVEDDEGGAFAYLGQTPAPFVGQRGLPVMALLLLVTGVRLGSRARVRAAKV